MSRGRSEHLSLSAAVRWRAFQALLKTVAAAPEAAQAMYPALGSIAWALAAGRREAVKDNLRHLLPEAPPERIARECRAVFIAAARYYVDFMSLRTETAELLNARLDVRGYEHFEAARAAGRGVIIAGIHHGPAEIVLQAFAARGVFYTAMVERLAPPQLAALMDGVRTGYGQTYVHPDIAGTRALLRALRGGGVVAMLVDRAVAGSAVPVRIAGGTMRVPTGAMELARATGAAVIPALASWEGRRRMSAVLLPPHAPPGRHEQREAVVRATEQLLACYMPHLRRLPGQWLVLERLFV